MGLLFIAIGDILGALILHIIAGFSYDLIKSSIVLKFVDYLFISVIVITIVNLIKKLNKVMGVSEGINFKRNLMSTCYVGLTLLMLGLIAKIYEYVPVAIERIYISLLLILSIIFIIVNFLVLYINNRYIQQKSEYEQLKVYTSIVENLISDIRKFRHDYINIVSSFQGFIENNDMEGLKEYYQKEIVNESKVVNTNTNMLQLQNIKNPAVKGLLSSKIVQAEDLGIGLHFEVLDEIENIPVRTIDICKILGILMDNAIEAAEESKDKALDIGIMKENDYILIVISNSYKAQPDLSKIFLEGFSTKGENRGIGLSTVKNLTDRHYTNILLNTLLEKNRFKQELSIKVS
jgi:two-component system sensor histidine kinase AgrC